MAFSHGKSGHFAIGTNGAETTPTDISAYLDNVDFPENVEPGETTVFGDASKTYVSGLRDATFSVSGKFDPTVDGILAGVLGNAIPLAFAYGPTGNTTGSVRLTAAGGAGNPGAFLTSYEISTPVGDVVTFTAEFQVSDTPTRDTFP